MKKYLSSPLVLVAPQPREPLFLYIAATNQTVSGVLVAEREQERTKPKKVVTNTTKKPRTMQFPVYYVSSMLLDARERYPQIQKILLGVILAARKLRHYFEAHPIIVRTWYPLQRVLSNTHAPSRVAEWAVELSHFDIRFDNDKAIKSKALADFLADWTEWTPTPIEEHESLSPLPGMEDPHLWIMYFDGAFSYEGAGVGVVIEAPTGEQLKYVVQIVEYEGLLAGLQAAAGLGIQRLVVRGDFQLVVNQVCKEYDSPRMWAYLEEARC